MEKKSKYEWIFMLYFFKAFTKVFIWSLMHGKTHEFLKTIEKLAKLTDELKEDSKAETPEKSK
ncbi:hypothetical protein QBE53_05945 [Vallitaleaceae bacterium 9-2]